MRVIGKEIVVKFSTLIVAAGIVGGLGAAAPAFAQSSVWDGVYTAAQAEAGAAAWEGSCAACHGPAANLDRFDNQTLGEAFAFISTQMPQDDPGSLEKSAYTNILAYLLQYNEFPAGETALTQDALPTIQLNFTR
jgi:quinoprotein glucose dehydrogenase